MLLKMNPIIGNIGAASIQKLFVVRQLILTQFVKLQRRIIERQLFGRRKQQRSKPQQRWRQLQTLTASANQITV